MGDGGDGRPDLVKAPSESVSQSHTKGAGGAGGGGSLIVSSVSGAAQLLSPIKASQSGQFKNTKGIQFCKN